MTTPPSSIATKSLRPRTGDALLATLLLDDTVADCNERFCRMLRCERSAVIGKPFLDLCPEIQADGAFSRERWQRRWHAARAGLPQWFPWQSGPARASARRHSCISTATRPSAPG